MELRWDGVPSLSEAMAMLKRQVDRTPAPQWVRVVGGFAPDLRAHAAAVVGKKDIDCIVSGGLDFDVDGTSLAIRKRVSDRIKEEVSQQLSVWSRVAVHFQTGLAIDVQRQALLSEARPQAHNDLFGQIAEIENPLIRVVPIGGNLFE